MTPLRRLISYFVPYKRMIIFGISCVFMTNLVRMTAPLVLRKAVDDSSRVVIASPPAGREDIGDCRFKEAWRQVADALGVRLSKLLRQVRCSIADRVGSGVE